MWRPPRRNKSSPLHGEGNHRTEIRWWRGNYRRQARRIALTADSRSFITSLGSRRSTRMPCPPSQASRRDGQGGLPWNGFARRFRRRAARQGSKSRPRTSPASAGGGISFRPDVSAKPATVTTPASLGCAAGLAREARRRFGRLPSTIQSVTPPPASLVPLPRSRTGRNFQQLQLFFFAGFGAVEAYSARDSCPLRSLSAPLNFSTVFTAHSSNDSLPSRLVSSLANGFRRG